MWSAARALCYLLVRMPVTCATACGREKRALTGRRAEILDRSPDVWSPSASFHMDGLQILDTAITHMEDNGFADDFRLPDWAELSDLDDLTDEDMPPLEQGEGSYDDDYGYSSDYDDSYSYD